jgi:argininosuccinate lyase
MTHQPDAFHRPIWDRGEPIDPQMLAFTVGDDWLQDRRLVEVDIQGSLAHADGLLRSGLLSTQDHAQIRGGLEALLASHGRGEWTVEPADEDVHSAVERRLIAAIGDAGKRLHTGRSRNDQVALDLRLWLRGALELAEAQAGRLVRALEELAAKHGGLPLPGYTHGRRAMPSSVGDWASGYAAALVQDLADGDAVRRRLERCPLGSGSGYGVPLPLDRGGNARALGFAGPEEPVTLTQLTRGRAELAYLSWLEGLALSIGKLCFDLWSWGSEEHGFVALSGPMTTGSSLMPHKRNPDVLELARAHCRQIIAERAALLDLLRDLPSGYHRDFQLIKPALFRAHDRMAALLPLLPRVLAGLTWDPARLEEACADPKLHATARALERVQRGETFRDAYRAEAGPTS